MTVLGIIPIVEIPFLVSLMLIALLVIVLKSDKKGKVNRWPFLPFNNLAIVATSAGKESRNYGQFVFRRGAQALSQHPQQLNKPTSLPARSSRRHPCGRTPPHCKDNKFTGLSRIWFRNATDYKDKTFLNGLKSGSSPSSGSYPSRIALVLASSCQRSNTALSASSQPARSSGVIAARCVSMRLIASSHLFARRQMFYTILQNPRKRVFLQTR